MRKAGAIVVAILTAAALYLFEWRVVTANRALRHLFVETELATAKDADEVVRARRARESLAGLVGLETHTPLDQLIWSLRARNAFALNRMDDAELWNAEALRWGERPELLLALADAQAANGKTEEAIRNLLRVAQFDAFMLTRTVNPALRSAAMERFESTATPESRAEAYLNMGIGYLEEGYPKEGAAIVATGALRDPSILVRREFASYGPYPTILALQQYAELRRQLRQPR